MKTCQYVLIQTLELCQEFRIRYFSKNLDQPSSFLSKWTWHFDHIKFQADKKETAAPAAWKVQEIPGVTRQAWIADSGDSADLVPHFGPHVDCPVGLQKFLDSNDQIWMNMVFHKNGSGSKWKT